MTLYWDIDELRNRPATTLARVEARDERTLNRQAEDEAAFQASVDRAAEEMDAIDVFREACEFDEDRLAKLMEAYRERHRSTDCMRYYLWLLENTFEEAAEAAAKGIARRSQNEPHHVTLWDEV